MNQLRAGGGVLRLASLQLGRNIQTNRRSGARVVPPLEMAAVGATTTAAESKRFAVAMWVLVVASRGNNPPRPSVPHANPSQKLLRWRPSPPPWRPTAGAFFFKLQGLVKSTGSSVKSTAMALYAGTFTLLQELMLRTKKLTLANYPTLTGLFAIGLLALVAVANSKEKPKYGHFKAHFKK